MRAGTRITSARAKESEAETEKVVEKEEIMREANVLIEGMDKEIVSRRRIVRGPGEAVVTTEQMMEGGGVTEMMDLRVEAATGRQEGAADKGMSSSAAAAVGWAGGGSIWSEE